MSDTHDPTQVAEDAVASGEAVAVPSVGGLVNGAAAILLQGTSLARAGVGLGAETARIAAGRSDVAPARGDWRFKDPTWSGNPLYKRIAQTYLAACNAIDNVIDDMDASGDWHRTERARFVMG